jgi:hypothetical protein
MRSSEPDNSPAQALAAVIEEKLRRGKSWYDKARRPDDQRAALGFMIAATIDLINSIEPWRREKLGDPLRDLLAAFMSLEIGTVEPLLRHEPRRGNRSSVSEKLVHAYAAAASAMLMRGGWSEGDADQWVAKRLSKAGYLKGSSARADTNSITAATVDGWRKAAREAAADDPLRMTYEQWLGEPHNADAERDAGFIIDRLCERFRPQK